jgi:hypothetical protein
MPTVFGAVGLEGYGIFPPHPYKDMLVFVDQQRICFSIELA